MNQGLHRNWRSTAIAGRRTLIIVLLGFIVVLPVWSVRYLPLQDYPDLLMQGTILAHWSDSNAELQSYYDFQPLPAPRLAALSVLYAFSQVLPIEVAGKLTLSLYLILFPLGVLYLLRSIQQRQTNAELIGFLLVYNFWFFQGSIDYLLGMTVTFFALGYLVRSWNEFGWPQVLATAGLSTLCYLSHIVGFVTFLLVSGLLLLVTPTQRWRRTPLLLAAALPGLALFTWYFLLTRGTSVLGVDLLTSLPNKLIAFAMPLLIFFRFEPFSSPLPVTVANVGFWIVLGGWLLLGMNRQNVIRSRNHLLIGLLLLGVVLIAPVRIGQLWRFDDRVTLLAYIMLLSAHDFRPLNMRLDLLCIVLTLCVSGLQVVQMRTPSDRLAEIAAVSLETIPENSRVLAVTVRGYPIDPGCHDSKGDEYSIAVFSSIRFPLYALLETDRFNYGSLFDVALLRHQGDALRSDLVVQDVLRGDLAAFRLKREVIDAEWNAILAHGCLPDLVELTSVFSSYKLAHLEDGAMLLLR